MVRGVSYRGAMRPLLLVALLALLAACAADPTLTARDCTPGTTAACACVGGATGVQTCTAAGTVGACVCPDAGSGADAVSVVDAPAADVVSAPDVVPALDVVDAGGSDVVDAGPVCDGSLMNDPANCGACGNACPVRANAGVDCNAGTCGFLCRAGFADCDRTHENGCETNTSTNVMSCGACGRFCATGQVCEFGRCKAPCAEGLTRCDASATSDGACVDLNTDRGNCGACRMGCWTTDLPRCRGGACVPG